MTVRNPVGSRGEPGDRVARIDFGYRPVVPDADIEVVLRIGLRYDDGGVEWRWEELIILPPSSEMARHSVFPSLLGSQDEQAWLLQISIPEGAEQSLMLSAGKLDQFGQGTLTVNGEPSAGETDLVFRVYRRVSRFDVWTKLVVRVRE